MDSLAEKAAKLPLLPGVYLMRDAAGKIIYVGKAKALRNRVSSYFHGAHNEKTEAMLRKVADFDVVIATGELEAFVLENDLIKHHMPHYNILLKDDKGYPFVRLDPAEAYPRFRVVSEPADDGAEYFGPFGSRSTLFKAVDAVLKALGLPTCGKVFPRDVGKGRPCLNEQLGLCRGWCRGGGSREEYAEKIRQARQIFLGHSSAVVRRLQEEMLTAAEEMRFERAASLRDTVKAVQALQTKQFVWNRGNVDTDAAGFYREGGSSCFVVLHYIEGKLLDKDCRMLTEPLEEDPQALCDLVLRYYSSRDGIPERVCVPDYFPAPETTQQYLTQLCGHRVELLTPQRGDKLRFVDTAMLNAREELARRLSEKSRARGLMLELGKVLGMSDAPRRVEAYDISHLGGEDITASMTVFVDGRAQKSAWRKFKIRLEKQDDCASMAEVVARRLQRGLDGDEHFLPMPDLLLLDGDAPQVRAAAEAAEKLGLKLPAFGMVKDDRHHTRELVNGNGEEIGLRANRILFSWVGNVQEETHRFAIGYQKKLREKKTRASELDKIPGVGEKRKLLLLQHFGSVKNVAAADPEKLASILPRNAAQAVYAYFHREDT